MTYPEALSYLDSLTNYERQRDAQAMRRVRLDRMRRLCERLDHPEARFRSILVAGTNGKGSICAMIYEILRRAGVRAGLYTSPHVEHLRERIRVTGGTEWIEEHDLADALSRVREAAEALTEFREDPPTYFEILTAAAFQHFSVRGIDVAVLEVGLGGRWDATNVVTQSVSVLGPIGHDHTEVLGESLREIAGEKAAIIKPGSVVLSSRQHPEAADVIREAAVRAGATLVESGRDVAAEILACHARGMTVAIRGRFTRYEALEVPLLGRHQAENAAIAVSAVESLLDVQAPEAAVRSGLAGVRWPGRMEVLREAPIVVLDGAHNPPAAQAARRVVEEWWPGRPVRLLIGMSQDKAVERVADVWVPLAASVVCTRSRHARACDPARLAAAFAAPDRPAQVIESVAEAAAWLVSTAAAQDVILVTGSLFLVGEIRALMERGGVPCPSSPLNG